MEMPSRNQQIESLERLNKPLGEANGTPLSDRLREAALPKQVLKDPKSHLFPVGFQRFAQQQAPRLRVRYPYSRFSTCLRRSRTMEPIVPAHSDPARTPIFAAARKF